MSEPDRVISALMRLGLSYICAGWKGIESWKCASRGCCYDIHTPQTVGDDNAKVSQPECYAQNAAPSNYDLAEGLTAAGDLLSAPQFP